MWSRLQMLLRPKWLIRLKQKREAEEVRVAGTESSRVQEKLNGLLQKVERGSCSLAQPGMEEAGHLWSGQQRDPRKWQNCSEPVSSFVRQGWDCLPPEALVPEEATRCFTPDSASWTVLSGASLLKWLMCGSSLPASLHGLDCQACVLPAQSSLQIGLPWARWHVCMLVCECVCLDPCAHWAEVCAGIFDAWAWALTSSGKEPS